MTDPQHLRLVEPPVDYDRRACGDPDCDYCPPIRDNAALDVEAWLTGRERRIDYAYIVAGALCAVAGLGLAWWGGVL